MLCYYVESAKQTHPVRSAMPSNYTLPFRCVYPAGTSHGRMQDGWMDGWETRWTTISVWGAERNNDRFILTRGSERNISTCASTSETNDLVPVSTVNLAGSACVLVNKHIYI